MQCEYMTSLLAHWL